MTPSCEPSSGDPRGSENGAEHGCVLYSLLATCKLHGVNPFDYLRDVVMRVTTHDRRGHLDGRGLRLVWLWRRLQPRVPRELGWPRCRS